MDATVKDGVHVFSIPLRLVWHILLRFWFQSSYFSIFAAVPVKGVIVVYLESNYGLSKHTSKNDAPWILIVATGTVDRNFRSVIKLGKGYYGKASYQASNYTSIPFPLTDNNTTLASNVAANYKGNIIICLDHLLTDWSNIKKSVAGLIHYTKHPIL